MKKIRRKSFLTSWDSILFEYPEWWNKIPSYPIKEIGDIFNFNYLIFFNQETDDYLHGWDTLLIDKEILVKFKNSLKELLPKRESFEKIEPIKILSQLSSSICYDSKSAKSKPYYQVKNKYLYFSKERGICKRAVVKVGPSNIRDTVLNDPADLNTINLIDQQILEILSKMKGHIQLRNNQLITKRLQKLYDKFHYFLHRDIKKEGITKPRILLKIMLEALNEEYPDIEIFEYTSFFDNFSLLKDNEILSPIRGHGLGMANSLTTLMQLVIHNLINEALIDEASFGDNDLLCLNDDFVAGFKDENSLEDYWDMEDEILKKLGIIREPTKSFYSYNCFVLAERYFTIYGEYEKESYQRRELLYPLQCFNITHAKDYFNSAQTFCDGKYIQEYIGEIFSYWGYEFFPEEIHYPYIVGGWKNERLKSVDLSLISLESLDYKSYIAKAYYAMQYVNKKPAKGNLIDSPSQILYGYSKIPTEFHAYFDILTHSQLLEKYGRNLSLNPATFKSYWSKIYKVRQKIFKRNLSITYENLLEIIFKENPTNNYYPNDTMINCFHPCEAISVNIDDIYIDKNPKLSCLAKFNDIDYPFKETFSIRFTDVDRFTRGPRSILSKDIQKSLNSESSCKITGKYAEIYWPTDNYDPNEQYINPINIAEVTALINWGKGFPELKPNFRSPLVDEKKEIYHRFFSPKELMLFKKYKLNRVKIKLICEYVKYSDSNFEEILEYINDNIPISYEEPIKEEINLDQKVHKNIWESPYPELNSDEQIRLTVDDIFRTEGGIFWNYKNDENSYYFPTKEDQKVINDMLILYTYATFPGLSTRDDCALMMEQTSKEPLLHLLCRITGVWKLLDDYANNKVPDFEDIDFGLLFEGEE